MRIIQIIDVRWYNAGADFAVTQAKALSMAGHDVLLMANPGSPPAARARKYGLATSEKIDFSGSNIFRSAGKLVDIARRFEPDIVFAHRGESHLAAALAARKAGFKVARFRGDVRPPRRDLFSRYLNERLTGGIAVATHRLKDEYEKRFRLNGIPVRVIYPAIDCSRFDHGLTKEQLKIEFGFDPLLPVVGIVGRLSPVKGHEFFLKAARSAQDKNPGVSYVIAGGDAQLSAERLRLDAQEAGLENIHFFGIMESIDRLISAFDVGVVASTGSEMICRVLMEYLAAGIPAVATEINQVSEIMSVSGGGIAVPPADSSAMAEAILTLLTDGRRAQDLSESGHGWVKSRRSLEALALESEDFLRRVIDE